MTAALLQTYRPGRSAVAATALFWLLGGLLWLAWGTAPVQRVLGIAGQLWLSYSAVSLVLAAHSSAATLRWPRMLVAATLAALGGAALGLPLLADFAWQRLASPWLPPRLFTASAIALSLHLLPLAARWREAQRHQREAERLVQAATVAELSRQVTLAELKALQAQVEPHFLYNTLAGIQYLVRHKPALADRMLGRLHDYLRLALPAMREPMSTLAREFALAEAYLALMQMRLGERLRASLLLPPALGGHPVPPLMLGSLIENAIQHGIEPKPQGGDLRVEAVLSGQVLRLSVSDGGVGLRAYAPSAGGGVGLSSLRERLRLLYADAAQLDVVGNELGGVTASITLPHHAQRDPD